MDKINEIVNEVTAIREISEITDKLSVDITRLLSDGTKGFNEISRINLSLISIMKSYLDFLAYLEDKSNLDLIERSFLLNSGVYSLEENLKAFKKISLLYLDQDIKDISVKHIYEKNYRERV